MTSPFEQLELDFTSSARHPTTEQAPTLVLAYSRPKDALPPAPQSERRARVFDGLASYARALPW